MKNSKLLVKTSKLSAGFAAIAILAFTGCNSVPTSGPCAGLSSCTENGTTGAISFPDGDGGTLTCTGGTCTDANTQQNAYNSGVTDGQNAEYNTGYNDGYSEGYSNGFDDGEIDSSVGSSTKDTDLQAANVQQKSLQDRAQFIANQFQMSLTAATQLTQLSDRVQQMATSGQMTAQDRTAVTQAALGIAQVSVDQVNDAITRMGNGDSSAADALMDKAASNLGMPSSAVLRDQLLPALGFSAN